MIMSGRTVWHIPNRPSSNRQKGNNKTSGRNPNEKYRKLVPTDLARHTLAAVFNAAGYDTS